MFGLMDMVFLIGGFAGGFLINYFFNLYQERRGVFYGIGEIKKAKKGRKKVFLLETENAFWIGSERASFQNISITKGRNLVLVGPNSIKPAYGLGGVLLGVGDLYRATTIPRELRQTIVFLKVIGFSDKEITEYLSKIHGYGVTKEGVTATSSAELAENYLLNQLDDKINKLENAIQKEKDVKRKKELENKKKLLELIREKREIYLTTPSTIVNYLQTGINRVTLKAQLKQIIDEKMLEKMGQVKWIEIGIMIFIILLGLWMLLGGGAQGLIDMFGKMIGGAKSPPAPPPR